MKFCELIQQYLKRKAELKGAIEDIQESIKKLKQTEDKLIDNLVGMLGEHIPKKDISELN